MEKISVAIIGAGMGGLAAAAGLSRAGLKVTVYEQATKFTRLGAGIQIGCNAMKVLREWGLEPVLRRAAFYPRSWNNREYDTGDIRFDMIFGPAAEEKYGAPYLLGHRGDLHTALASAVSPELIRLDHKVIGFEQLADQSVSLRFANGESVIADAVVAADGVHSLVKDELFGRQEPNFTGRIAYRTVFPASLLNGYAIDDCTKWWGPDRHIVIYYVKPDRSEVYFVTSQPEPGFTVESWSAMGDVGELRRAFADFHPQVRHVLEACPSVHKWALVDRDPIAALVRWQRDVAWRCVPSDDAVHGAGGGDGDRGCGGAVALPARGRSRRRGQRVPALRSNAKRADVTRSAQFAHEYVAQRPHQSGLGLSLRCVEGAAGQSRAGATGITLRVSERGSEPARRLPKV